MVIKTTGVDKSSAIVKRRYTDFLHLHDKLKERFPHVIQHLEFPKKLLIGNFKLECIMRRSRAFEKFLSVLYSVKEIRHCHIFVDFFYVNELKKAYSLIRAGQHEDAIPLLNMGLNSQLLLLGQSHPETIATLCGLVVVFNKVDDLSEALALAQQGLSWIGFDTNQVYLIPLLQLSIRLCWSQGKDKKHLEQWLADLGAKGLDVVGSPTLLELAAKRFASSHL